MRRSGSGEAFVASWAAEEGTSTRVAASAHPPVAGAGLNGREDPHVAGLLVVDGEAAGSERAGHLPVAAHAGQQGADGYVNGTANGAGPAAEGVQEESSNVYEGVTVVTLDDGTLVFKF